MQWYVYVLIVLAVLVVAGLGLVVPRLRRRPLPPTPPAPTPFTLPCPERTTRRARGSWMAACRSSVPRRTKAASSILMTASSIPTWCARGAGTSPLARVATAPTWPAAKSASRASSVTRSRSVPTARPLARHVTGVRSRQRRRAIWPAISARQRAVLAPTRRICSAGPSFRRRSPAAADAGPRGARVLHPRHIRPARALVQARHGYGPSAGLRHLLCRGALRVGR